MCDTTPLILIMLTHVSIIGDPVTVTVIPPGDPQKQAITFQMNDEFNATFRNPETFFVDVSNILLAYSTPKADYGDREFIATTAEHQGKTIYHSLWEVMYKQGELCLHYHKLLPEYRNLGCGGKLLWQTANAIVQEIWQVKSIRNDRLPINKRFKHGDEITITATINNQYTQAYVSLMKAGIHHVEDEVRKRSIQHTSTYINAQVYQYQHSVLFHIMEATDCAIRLI